MFATHSLTICAVLWLISRPALSSPSNFASNLQSRLNVVQDELLDTDTWLSGELSVILENGGRLDSYARKPDCFRRVAASIRVQCGELDMNEDERVRAAAAMALCELATARQSPPLECVPIMLSETPTKSSRASLSSCVEALSRSAQYWSSYSGYLREVPQLCHAFRRWNDIDSAKETYRNATLEAISVLRAMNESETRQQSLQNDIEAVTSYLQHTIHGMSNAGVALERSSQAILQELRMTNQQTVSTVENALQTSFARHSDGYAFLTNQLAENLQTILGDHALALDLLLPSLQMTLEVHLSETFSEVRGGYQDINEIVNQARHTLQATSVEFGHLHAAVSTLAATIEHANSALELHVDQAHLASRIHSESAESAVRLTQILSSVADQAYEEMSNINKTAAAVRESLSNPSFAQSGDWQYWAGWSKYVLLWLMRFFWQVNGLDFEWVLQTRLLHGLGLVTQFAFYLLRSSVAILTSFILLFASLKQLPSFSTLRTPKRTTDDDDRRMIAIANCREENFKLSSSRIRANPRAAVSLLPRSLDGNERFSRIPARLYKPTAEKL